MDIIDIRILSRLLNNCRESDRRVGKELGISGGAVRTRIRKMVDNKIIEKFTIKVEPPLLGFGVIYLVVSGQKIDEILEHITLVGEPSLVVPCVGGITVCSIVVKEDIQQKISLLEKLMRDVRILSIFEAESPIVNANFTKTDFEILEKLIEDPTEKIEDIAKYTSFSTKTITRGIDKFFKNEGVQFTVIYDPTKTGNFISHALVVWIDADTKKVLVRLNQEFQEYYMQNPFLAKNQIVLFMYSKDVFEMDRITQKIREIENVKSVDLFIPKKISLPLEWLKSLISKSKNSKKLHLEYPTN